MKAERAARAKRKDSNLTAHREDSYKSGSKMPDPAACPRCRASYLKGRWTWREAPADAASHTCPACLRIEDDFPAGYVTLKGPFLAGHREEVLNLVNARALRAREEHPMQRVIGVADVAQGILVTTTDAHLARGIAVAVHEAFKGNLSLNFSRDENLVRATWTR
jgi:hypothetical protein